MRSEPFECQKMRTLNKFILENILILDFQSQESWKNQFPSFLQPSSQAYEYPVSVSIIKYKFEVEFSQIIIPLTVKLGKV